MYKVKITSPAFKENSLIPEKYTCEGQNNNPSLDFENIPVGTTSLALIVSDPDAPGKTFYHWILFNMDSSVNHIDESSIPKSAIQGTTDFGNAGYGGPCPPSGIHRYIYTLYALDRPLDLDKEATAQEVLKAMKGHVINSATLMGKYSKKKFTSQL